MTKKTLITEVQDVITDATSQDLQLLPFSGQPLVCYDRIVAADLTSGVTLITIGFLRGSNEVLLVSGTPAAVGGNIVMEGKVFAPAVWRPFARFKGATLGDKVCLYVFGYLTDNPE